MTLQQFQDILHSLYQGDTDAPTSTDTAWTHRVNLLKAAIGAWNGEKGILWNELFTMLSDASDGDKTVVADTLEYDCPVNFRFPGGFVRTFATGGASTYWKVMSPQKAELIQGQALNVCFFTGNANSGYTLHFVSQPQAGHTIDYPYYKTPFEPSSAAHVLEMSDPYFAVYFVLSKLHEIDGEGDRAIKAFNEAAAKLSGMRTTNEMPAWFQDNNTEDRDWATGSGGFGE